MVLRVLAGLAAAILLAAGGLYLFLLSSLPQTSGRILVRGLDAPVTIARDAFGVPLITATNDTDAAFGLGFAHAQDRLFQMELMRRLGAGRLAEIFGPKALPTDRLMRVLGLSRLAAAELPYLSPAVRRALAAYAAGVNAFLESRRGALPPEFQLLRFAPQPWRPADSLVWGKLMALRLSSGLRSELLRAQMARSIPAADLRVLFPRYPATAPTILSEMLPRYRRLPLDRLYAALPGAVGPVHASNAWVVDGRHSASGKPLLANDPHLAFGAPGPWYLARLKTPTGEIAGATAPGIPFVVIGHNGNVAWGFTTMGADIEDLFVEKTDPENPDHYLTPEGSAAFVVRHEKIRVRGAPAVDLAVRGTRHGPVVSDVLPAGSAPPGLVLALAATFLRPDDRSAEALWEMDRAHDWASFHAALEKFVGPPQDIVFADKGGTIGFIAAGLIPIRKSGTGAMPEPGWTGDHDWIGFIPFSALPSATNPPSGRFVTANDKIVGKNYPYFLGRGWDLPNRAERIAALLTKNPLQTPRSSAAIEADTFSLMAARLAPLMTRTSPSGPLAEEAIRRLKHWDFRMDRQKVAPLLFTAWLREFSHAVLFGRFGSAVADYWDLRPNVMEGILLHHRDWCRIRGEAGCRALLAASLDAALEKLRTRYGADMSAWRWGRAHVAHFPNPVFDRLPLLGRLLRVAISTAGGYDTLNRGPSTIRDPRHPFEQRFGAGLRIITDLSVPKNSQMMIVPGQSGNPLSRHFEDLLRPWRDFGWLRPGRAAARATVTLSPQPGEKRP